MGYRPVTWVTDHGHGHSHGGGEGLTKPNKVHYDNMTISVDSRGIITDSQDKNERTDDSGGDVKKLAKMGAFSFCVCA